MDSPSSLRQGEAGGQPPSSFESGLAPGPYPRPRPGAAAPRGPYVARLWNLQRKESGRRPCPPPGPPAGQKPAWRTCHLRGWLSISLHQPSRLFPPRSGPGSETQAGSPHTVAVSPAQPSRELTPPPGRRRPAVSGQGAASPALPVPAPLLLERPRPRGISPF